MAVPKSKISRSARGMRRAHVRLKTSSLSSCPNCQNTMQPHRVCPHCGHFGGKQIVAIQNSGKAQHIKGVY